MKSRPSPLLVAIVGGSGAGKSWLADKLAALSEKAARISLDDFYRDRSRLSPARRAKLNFDHPRAIDWQRLEALLKTLLAGQAARLPCYDFATHCRVSRENILPPNQIVLVEGLWLLRRASLRRLFDLKIFIDCPKQTRLERRLARDLVSRGRTEKSIREQFRHTVEPMHVKFVAPQKRWADVVLPSDFGEREVQSLARAIHAAFSDTSTLRTSNDDLAGGRARASQLRAESKLLGYNPESHDNEVAGQWRHTADI